MATQEQIDHWKKICSYKMEDELGIDKEKLREYERKMLEEAKRTKPTEVSFEVNDDLYDIYKDHLNMSKEEWKDVIRTLRLEGAIKDKERRQEKIKNQAWARNISEIEMEELLTKAEVLQLELSSHLDSHNLTYKIITSAFPIKNPTQFELEIVCSKKEAAQNFPSEIGGYKVLVYSK